MRSRSAPARGYPETPPVSFASSPAASASHRTLELPGRLPLLAPVRATHSRLPSWPLPGAQPGRERFRFTFVRAPLCATPPTETSPQLGGVLQTAVAAAISVRAIGLPEPAGHTPVILARPSVGAGGLRPAPLLSPSSAPIPHTLPQPPAACHPLPTPAAIPTPRRPPTRAFPSPSPTLHTSAPRVPCTRPLRGLAGESVRQPLQHIPLGARQPGDGQEPSRHRCSAAGSRHPGREKSNRLLRKLAPLLKIC